MLEAYGRRYDEVQIALRAMQGPALSLERDGRGLAHLAAILSEQCGFPVIVTLAFSEPRGGHAVVAAYPVPLLENGVIV